MIVRVDDNGLNANMESKSEDKTETIEHLAAALEPHKDEARFLVIDHKWVAADGRKISKMCVVGYAPDVCAKNDKVIISSNLTNFKDAMPK